MRFQSTRPRGARPRSGRWKRCRQGFNPRAHVGRDWRSCWHRPRIPCFNPRAHVGRDQKSIVKSLDPSCFNPRAHVGRDIGFDRVSVRVMLVSIHAPTWGATWRLHNASVEYAVSIHAPTWGATSYGPAVVLQIESFNPRAHVGRDSRLPRHKHHPRRFNPRAHVGRDLPALAARSPARVFQSTRPRGARHMLPAEALDVGAVSIHAPTWGATAPLYRRQIRVRQFQSTRPRGARPGVGCRP